MSVITIVLIALFAGGALFGIKTIVEKLSNNHMYIYSSGETYYYSKNLEKDSGIEIGHSSSNFALSSSVHFTPDNKYVYFFTDIEDYTGNLCKAEVKDLDSKTPAYDCVETVDTGVDVAPSMLNNGVLLYRKEIYRGGYNHDDDFYMYDGKDIKCLGRDIGRYYTDGESKVVFSVYENNDGESYDNWGLYCIDTNEPDNIIKMDSNILTLSYCDRDLEFIQYTKVDEEDNETEYVAGFGKKGEEKDGFTLISDEKNNYLYTVSNGEKISLYDYVEDNEKDNPAYDTIRHELKDKENDIHVEKLCANIDGKEIVIADNVVNLSGRKGMIVYNTVDMVGAKISIEDVENINSVKKMFDIDVSKANYFLIKDPHTTIKMSEKVANYVLSGEDENPIFMATDSGIYVECNNEISEIKLENNQMSQITSVARDIGEILGVDDSNIFYTTGFESNGETSYGDIYRINDGKSNLVAKHVKDEIVGNDLFEDGVLIAYTDYAYYDEKGSGELAQFDLNGNKTKIGNDVTDYLRVSEKELLLISDGDLYLFDGKNKKELRKNVEAIWCSKYMERTETLRKIARG